MTIRGIFPNGEMNYILEIKKEWKMKGILDKGLKNKEVIMLPMQESDIMDIRETLLEEVRRQND